MTAHEPIQPLTEATYAQVTRALNHFIAEAKQNYDAACAAHAAGTLDEAELLRRRSDLDVQQAHKDVLENAWAERQRLDALQATNDEAHAAEASRQVILRCKGTLEREFAAMVEEITALSKRSRAIQNACEKIADEAKQHRQKFRNLPDFGDALRDIREVDFRMRGLVQDRLHKAGIGNFVLGIGPAPDFENVDATYALAVKFSAIGTVLASLRQRSA